MPMVDTMNPVWIPDCCGSTSATTTLPAPSSTESVAKAQGLVRLRGVAFSSGDGAWSVGSLRAPLREGPDEYSGGDQSRGPGPPNGIVVPPSVQYDEPILAVDAEVSDPQNWVDGLATAEPCGPVRSRVPGA
ncbi:hypothetical protein [Curtobacterium sp. PhB78]|uniref:hypothetical protein n=1 Tax=Curtobacterium sp. PhB78 TaxID=2485102 RepID=UPI0011CDB424|nr:hypothetical protein [Curtobacterium sp. PhB78]